MTIGRARAIYKQSHAIGNKTAFETPLLAGKPISRLCPRCDATPGQGCRRWVGGRINGEDVGGGYWRRLKTFHPERKAA